MARVRGNNFKALIVALWGIIVAHPVFSSELAVPPIAPTINDTQIETSDFIPTNMETSQDSTKVFTKVASRSMKYFMTMSMKANPDIQKRIRLFGTKLSFFFFNDEGSAKNGHKKTKAKGANSIRTFDISVNPTNSEAKFRVYTSNSVFLSVKMKQGQYHVALEHPIDQQTTLSLNHSERNSERIQSINLSMNW